MKNGKLLILLAALLCLAMVLASCAKDSETDAIETPSDPPTSSSTEDSTEDTVTDIPTEAPTEDSAQAPTAPDNDGGEDVTHEMQNYINLKTENTTPEFLYAAKLEGNIVDVYDYLAVTVKEDIDVYNNVITTYSVYDISLGEIIFEDSVSSPYGKLEGEDGYTSLEVSVKYPVISSKKISYTDKYNGNVKEVRSQTSTSYYIAKSEGEKIHTTAIPDPEFSIDYYGNNLVSVVMGDKIVWIDKNLNIIRTVDMITANGYDTNGFDSEYMGYLYSLGEKTIQIFNLQGICSANYIAGEDDILSSFVLNNGNVFVQKYTVLSAYGECDLTISGTRYNIESFIINATNGEITPLEVEFAVSSLSSEYSFERDGYGVYYYGETIAPAEGKQNAAIIYNIANGSMARDPKLVTVDNDMNITYTVKNDTVGISWDYAYAISEKLYSASVYTGGTRQNYIFNLDGEFIAVDGDGYITDDFIVTNTAIYDHEMNLVYDFETNGIIDYYVYGNRIYLTKINFKTGADKETYIFNDQTFNPVLFTDGINMITQNIFEGYYIIYDSVSEIYKLCNEQGAELLVSANEIHFEYYGEEAMLVSTDFNGNTVIYAIY